ncbi:MAG: flagellar biosynthetic protein FliR [Lachnospiraceae bacterium]|nr:flagellar biosynthetic protein FliR [Lachnospiraceae bacterium]
MIDYPFTFEDLEFYLLVMARVSAFIFVAPFFSMSNTPRRMRAGFSLVLAFLMVHTLTDHSVPAYSTVLGYSTLVLKETITGLMIGLGANMCMSIVHFAGKVADMEVGLSMVQLFDPMTREGTGFMGSFYQYILVLIMLVTNMHYYFLRAFVETFNLIPIGGARFSSEKIMTTMVQFLTDFITISFRLCLPIVAAMLLLNAILGVLAKTAPQVNMFSVGIQIKIIVGLGILFLTIGTIPSASEFIFKEMRIMMTAMVESLQ